MNYTATAKWFHWSMALIWLGAFALGMVAVYARELFNSEHQLTYLHKALASSLLFLLPLRIYWRLTHPTPRLPQSMSPLAQNLARYAHWALYAAALLALPVSGWFWSSVAGKPIMVLGLFQLPPLRAPDQGLYDTAKAIHVYTSWFCGALVGAHLLAALKHHFVDKDAVLRQMLPQKDSRA